MSYNPSHETDLEHYISSLNQPFTFLLSNQKIAVAIDDEDHNYYFSPTVWKSNVGEVLAR